MNNTYFLNLDEIHIPIIIKDVLKNFWLAILAVISVCIFVFAYRTLVYQSTYTTETTFVISPKSNGSYVSFYASLNTANEMAEVFQEVFTSDVLKRMILEDLDEPNLNFSVSCSVAKGTNILCVYTNANTPVQSHMAMQSLLNNYREVSGYLFGGVVLDILKTPQIPISPSNPPNIRRIMLIGSFIAIVFMLCLVVLFSILRPTVKTIQSAKRHLGESPLGVLYKEERPLHWLRRESKKAPLITDAGISFQYTETVLKFTHKLQHKMSKNNQKVLLVTSVAENEGKSAISSNLALALAEHGYKVALVDMDLRRPAIYKIFRRHSKIDLFSCFSTELPESLDGPDKLHILCSRKPCTDISKILHSPELFKLLDMLRQKMDYIIMDSSPYTVAADTGILLQHADGCVLVVRQDWAPHKVCSDVAEDLDTSKADYLGYIYNHYQEKRFINQPKRYYQKYGYYDTRHVEEQ